MGGLFACVKHGLKRAFHREEHEVKSEGYRLTRRDYRSPKGRRQKQL